MAEKYLLDSNIFITPHRLYYPLRFRRGVLESIRAHQFPYRFFFEKFIGMFQCSYLLAHKKRVRTRKPDLRFRCSLNDREYTTLSFQKSKGFLTVFSQEESQALAGFAGQKDT